MKLLAGLWLDCVGSSLMKYSVLIAITTVFIVLGVAVAGRWAAHMWTDLLPNLPP